MEYKLRSLNVGLAMKYEWNGKNEKSAIGKTFTEEAMLTKEGFVHDGVANPDFHGGPDRAVCFYPFEHYSMWEKEFNTTLEVPAFGENTTASGMLEKDVYIGDIFKLGDAVVQVTQGRIPCSTISKFNGIDLFLKRIVETGFTGFFFRVLEPGIVTSDSFFSLVERPNHRISVLVANEVMFHDRGNKGAIEEILLAKDLAVVWREKLEKALRQAK